MSETGKIGAIVYDLRASGVVRNLLRIAGSARSRGLDFEIWPLRPQGEFLAEAKDIGPVRPILPAPIDRQRDIDSLIHHSALSRTLEKRAPALVFSAGNQMHWHLAKAMQKIPTGHRPRVVARASNAVVSTGKTNALLRAAIRPQEFFQYSAMDHIVAVSDELHGLLVDRLLIPRERVSVIPNGIDVDRIAGDGAGCRTNRDSDAEGPLILGIGRLSKQKDFITLIDAVASLQTGNKPVLRILGRGTRGWRARLEKRAEQRGIADRFELPGHVTNVAEHLRQADLFVSSSRWEGASNAVLEALACGTPIVATQAPTGIREVLEPIGGGLLVPVGDAGALAAAMQNRLAQPRASGELVRRARDYDLSITLDRYCTLLSDQLSLAARHPSDSGRTQSARLRHN